MDNYVQSILQTVLHQGLREYKVKSSTRRVVPMDGVKTDKTGSIAGYFSKSSMADNRGVIFTSEEGLFEKASLLTHWTPNIFNYLTYTDSTKIHIKNHREDNLSQINTFVVDLDYRDAKEADRHKPDVLGTLSINDSIYPTLVLRSDKGYHVYYVLDEPVYLRRRGTQLRALMAAQSVAKNLKTEIQAHLPQVDVGCNNFGIFRIPRFDNIEFFEDRFTVPFSALLSWSKKYSETHKEQVKSQLHVVRTSGKFQKQMDQDWFRKLIQVTNVRPGEGLGRHNTILTLALACYSSEYDQGKCFDLLDEFNSRLEWPISNKDVQSSVRDAYSGHYSGASRDYINELVAKWAPNASVKHKSSPSAWYKFKKARADRKYSHSSEWEQDVLDYISSHAAGTGFVETSMRSIRDQLGISLASLDRALKQLRLHKQIIYRPGMGRKSAQFATVGSILRALKDSKGAYRDYLVGLVGFLGGREEYSAGQGAAELIVPAVRGTG